MKYRTEIIFDSGQVSDIALHLDRGKTWRLWGRSGHEQERNLAKQVPADALPVLLGTGLGVCLKTLLERGPVLVVDREKDILKATGLLTRYEKHENFYLLNSDIEQVLDQVSRLRKQFGFTQVHPIHIPLYLRLVPEYYQVLAKALCAMVQLQENLSYPHFDSEKPRVLILYKKYFLYREIHRALDALGCTYKTLPVPEGEFLHSEFIRDILSTVAHFKPDFALTVNHFGLDREGHVASIFEELALPLASWFVDSPQLIIYEYARQNLGGTCIFSYDASSLSWLKQVGFEHVHFLPLGTDPKCFYPKKNTTRYRNAKLGFAGDSNTTEVLNLKKQMQAVPKLQAGLSVIAAQFVDSKELVPLTFLKQHFPDIYKEVSDLADIEMKRFCERAVTFEAARQYRMQCLRGILPFKPLIAGDKPWADILEGSEWQHIGILDYYNALPAFYSSMEINFNCTSVQMKGAVNQRVFDVPACGAFLITDWREQIENLFEPGREVICYHHPEEVTELIGKWLADAHGRKGVARAARKRVLAQHTYAHRLQELIHIMRNSFSKAVSNVACPYLRNSVISHKPNK